MIEQMQRKSEDEWVKKWNLCNGEERNTWQQSWSVWVDDHMKGVGAREDGARLCGGETRHLMY